MTIKEVQDEIVDEFDFLSSWEEKYKYIIDLGKDMAPYPDEFRDEDHKVKGCQSQVWMHSGLDEDRIRFRGDSDAFIVKGLIALLMRIYDNQTPEEILSTPLDFTDRIGLSTSLSPTRSNGLVAMIKKIKGYALAYQALKKGQFPD
ncbi:MAG: SufE family protein [Bacteroidota bacterium]